MTDVGNCLSSVSSYVKNRPQRYLHQGPELSKNWPGFGIPFGVCDRIVETAVSELNGDTASLHCAPPASVKHSLARRLTVRMHSRDKGE